MILDGLTLRACTQEIKKIIEDGKIVKINMPQRDEVVFQVYTKADGTLRLNINASGDSSAVFLGDMKKNNPKTPCAFCMLLRKYLTGAHIKEVKLSGFDRALEIVFESKDELLHTTNISLVCEIMGKYSNIILLNAERKVMDAAKRISVDTSSLRQVLPGCIYSPPPQEQYDLSSLSTETLTEIITKSKGESIQRFLSRMFQGVSRQTASEILYLSGIEDENETDISDTKARIIAKTAKEIFAKALNEPCPSIQKNAEGLPVLVSSLSLETYPEDLRENFKTVNDAVYFYYKKRNEYFLLKQRKDVISKSLSKIQQKLAKKIKTLIEGIEDSKKAEALIKKANIITANIYMLKKGMDSFVGLDFETGESVEIALDKTLHPAQNAQKLFKRAAKMKTTKEIYEQRLKDAEKENEFILSSMLFTEKAESLDDLAEIEGILFAEKVFEKGRPKKLPEISEPKEYKSPSGYTILVGRNDKQNDRLTMGIAKKEDIWFHAQKMPGSHVLLITNGTDINDIDDETIEYAAFLAAKYSAAKLGGKTPVDYTYRANIKKPPASRPGKVIYDKYWTLYT